MIPNDMHIGPGAGMPGGAARTDAPNAATGAWNGLTAKAVKGPESLLAGAAAGLPQAVRESTEQALADFRVSRAARRDWNMRIATQSAYLSQFNRDRLDRLNRLRDAWRAALGNPALLREFAREQFPDCTERHAALLWLERELRENNPSLANTAEQERGILESEEGAAIQAGYNIHGVDATAIGGANEGRAVYRQVALGCENIQQMLEILLERAGASAFVETAEFLRRAVAADLSATTPSSPKEELEALNNDLYHLRTLANFTRDFNDTLAKLRRDGKKSPLPRAGLETLQLLCRAKDDPFLSLDALRAILALEGKLDPVYDVRALTETHRLASSLPTRLFSDAESRERLLTAEQKMLDTAIDLEEETLDL